MLTVKIIQADLTEETTDAIANAANNFLQHGKGVAGAIAKKGGPQIQLESNEYTEENGNVKTGQCAYTGPGKL